MKNPVLVQINQNYTCKHKIMSNSSARRYIAGTFYQYILNNNLITSTNLSLIKEILSYDQLPVNYGYAIGNLYISILDPYARKK